MKINILIYILFVANLSFGQSRENTGSRISADDAQKFLAHHNQVRAEVGIPGGAKSYQRMHRNGPITWQKTMAAKWNIARSPISKANLWVRICFGEVRRPIIIPWMLPPLGTKRKKFTNTVSLGKETGMQSDTIHKWFGRIPRKLGSAWLYAKTVNLMQFPY
jgi:hypothetical protein